MLKRLLLCIWLLLFLITSTTGQKAPLTFEGLTSAKGLSNNSINCIYQDSKGFLWFGTQNGLSRFDGYSFRVFHYNPNVKEGLSNDVITAMQEDNSGRLWIGTLNGLNIYSTVKRTFINFSNEQGPAMHLRNERISALCIDKSGIVWIGTENKGLSSYDPGKGAFKTYQEVKGFTSHQITAIAEGQDGTLWVGTDKGLNQLSTNGTNITRIVVHVHKSDDPETVGHNFINAIYQDRHGDIWAGTSFGLNKYIATGNTKESKAAFVSYVRNNSNNSLSHNDVKTITEDKEGNLWVGTRGGGLNKAKILPDTHTLRFIQYQNLPQNPNSLVQNEVFSVLQDRSGIIWAGTYNGISKINSTSTDFIHYQSAPSTKHGLAHNNVAAILTYRDGLEEHVLFGTSGGINQINSKSVHEGKESFVLFSDKSELDNRKTQCLFLYEPGILWIGTKKNLRVYDLYNKRFIQTPDALMKLPTGTIRKIYRDKTGLIWIGLNRGLYTWNPFLNKLSHPLIQSQASTSKNETKNFIEPTGENNVFAIEEDAAGNIWVGTWGGGLLKFITGKPEVTPVYYLNQSTDDKSVSSNYITALHYEKNGKLWVGTTDGLNLLARRGDATDKAAFTRFSKKSGFNNTHISGILQDSTGRLWIATPTGISQFNPLTQQVLNFSFPFGNITKENYTMGMARDSDGYLYFGGMSGSLSFHPDSIHYDTHDYPLVLTDLQIFGPKKMKGSTPEETSSSEVAYANHETINLTYKEYAFSFSFALLNYTISDKVNYAYMLEGVDKEWIYRNAYQRFASYSNLSPGTYSLKVKATNAYGNWTPPFHLLSIHVLTPFWKTWWAYLIYACLITFMLYTIGKFILSRERIRNNLKLARLEKEKVKEMDELKLQYFTNISHEFRTPLTLIAAPVEQLSSLLSSSKDRHVQKNLNLINHNVNHLLRLINQLLDFRKTEDNRMQLKTSQGDLIRFIQNITNTFALLAEKKSITIDCKTQTDHLEVWLDWDKVEKILNNLIYNAISFSPNHGNVTINVLPIEKTMKDGFVTISVADTGTGIPKEEIEKIFEVFYQANNKVTGLQAGYGIGLSLTKKLVELHKGTINVSSEPGKGTTFTIHLPIEKSQYRSIEIIKEPIDVTATASYPIPVKKSILITDTDEENLQDNKIQPTILIVDDNVDIRKYLVDCFEEDYQVIEAGNGIEGLDKAKNIGSDLVISDVMMPEMDGNEFCRQLKTNILTSHIPVILLTALDSTDHLIEGLETGADAYITKPFHLEVLEVSVRKLIKSRVALRIHFTNEALTQPKEVTVNSADEKFLTQAMTVIEAHISEDYSVDDFVRDMLMGRSVLYRKLKQLTNQSPNEFIRTVRLKRAAQLLSHQAGNISEICYQVGFTDPGYFTKCFRKQFGLTPKEFIGMQEQRNRNETKV